MRPPSLSPLCLLPLHVLILLALMAGAVMAAPVNKPADLVLVAPGQTPAIACEDISTARLAGELLARDLQALTGATSPVGTELPAKGKVCVAIGRFDSALVQSVLAETGTQLAPLAGEWERYERIALPSTRHPGLTYLLIAGSDRRGTVYGVIDLTRELGVSPWEWWADVTPRHVERLAVSGAAVVSAAPSVRYRGIFLNDEDWGLQPWAAKNYDPATGDLGPKTYARIYELMWRLKANTIWPAMHHCTKPFFLIPGNPEMAETYGIVIGSSHAEPMLRNNVGEWSLKERGDFNFVTNAGEITRYWTQRAQESRNFEALYTIGLRGVHDDPMEGATTAFDRAAVLTRVFAVQRNLLQDALGRPAAQIPQALTVYKEVEEAYNAGLKPAEDITLVWCDDNYGYLSRLSTPEEQRRSGGAGVYYHISYWGRPHDYLWLATTSPGLIREQMGRAFQLNARREWILNVGDIKPGEYLTQYFLDLAFDAGGLQRNPGEHLRRWLGEQFGAEVSGELAALMQRYYALAWERKPEFMGWGSVEPISPTRPTAYVQGDGEEAQRRLAAYETLVTEAETLAARIPADRRDAYFQLVLYPVRGAANLNIRILSLDLAQLYARQGRASANAYVVRARRAQETIAADTRTYNAQHGGKWTGIMDAAPRRLPVFAEPVYPHYETAAGHGWGVSFPGQLTNESENVLTLRQGRPAKRTLTVYAREEKPMAWKLRSSLPGLRPVADHGVLDATNGFEARVELAYDGSDGDGQLSVSCDGREQPVAVRTLPATTGSLVGETDRSVCLPATSAASNPAWEVVSELGSLGSCLRSNLSLPALGAPDPEKAPALAYRFATHSNTGGILRIVALPVHPLFPGAGLRLACSLDGGPLQTLDFESIGRSDEWRENVQANTAVRTLILKPLAAGAHELKVYALSPGFILDRLELDLDLATKHYGPPPTP